MKKTLFAVLFLTGLAAAAQLQVLEPQAQTVINGQTLDLGVVGPGQKVAVIAARPSGENSRNAAGQREALWDRLLVDNLPAGWSGENSKLYENPFQAFVTVAPDAADGQYAFTLQTLNEYDGIRAIAMNAQVRVSKDVLGFSIKNQPDQSTGVSQPAVYLLSIQNTGSASDAFELSVSGVPGTWAKKRRLFVPHNSEMTLSYEILPQEHGNYPLSFHVESLSNARISKNAAGSLKTETSVWNDLKSSANGVLLFPSIQQTAYALMALLAQFAR